MISYREKEKFQHKLVFHLGKKVEDITEPLQKGGKKHGAYMRFKPSKKFLGPTTKIPFEEMEEWIGDISYQLSQNVIIEYTRTNGLEVLEKKTFKKRDPIGLLEKFCGEVLIKPITITDSSEFEEGIVQPNSDKLVTKKRTASYTLMFAYDTVAEPIYASYCNFANTVEGGVHLDGAEASLCRFLQAKTKESMTDREKDRMDILWSDVRTGLKMVVLLSTNANVQFVGNSKERIGSELLAPILKEGFYTATVNYFEENQDKLKQLIKIVKTNARVRVESNKIREASTKETMNSFKELMVDGFRKCSNTGKQYKELYLFEGLSPQGGAANARDTHTQALLAFRGVTANPYKCSLADLMHPQTGNVELRRLVDILRCGIGPTFDLNKLYYDKIIIMTDADIDGAGICASLSSFFELHLPQIVEAGKLYRVVPPLYKLDDKTHPYARTKREMVDAYQDKILKSYKIAVRKISDDYLSKKEFKEFIYDTSDYIKNLHRISDHFKANQFLIEKIVAYLFYVYGSRVKDNFDLHQCFSDQKFVSNIMAYIQTDFPEITLRGKEQKIMSGIAEGRHQSILMGGRFLTKCSSLYPVIEKYGYSLIVDDGTSITEMSIGKFLQLTQKFVSKQLARYKGIGEMSAEDLMVTAMDPNNRMLIRLTRDDLRKEMEIFNKLYSPAAKYARERKQMMSEYVIDREDLDN